MHTLEPSAEVGLAQTLKRRPKICDIRVLCFLNSFQHYQNPQNRINHSFSALYCEILLLLLLVLSHFFVIAACFVSGLFDDDYVKSRD